MRRYTRLTQKERYSWAHRFQRYRGSHWTDEGWEASVQRRSLVNAGYWTFGLLGFRLARSEVIDVPTEV